MTAPLHNLSASSDKDHEAVYAYSMDDIDTISAKLGVPWKRLKDVPFGKVVPFISFDWDLENKMVSLQEKKKDKYMSTITEW